jgi:hypothetical protein
MAFVVCGLLPGGAEVRFDAIFRRKIQAARYAHKTRCLMKTVKTTILPFEGSRAVRKKLRERCRFPKSCVFLGSVRIRQIIRESNQQLCPWYQRPF